MADMRSCYDNLLSVAAAIANSAYEFSEALQEMGTCLLKRVTPNKDGINDKVLLLLGKSQFELRKLVDSYRVHVLNTITTPSQSLLNELQTVEVYLSLWYLALCAGLYFLLIFVLCTVSYFLLLHLFILFVAFLTYNRYTHVLPVFSRRVKDSSLGHIYLQNMY
jgi:hypothetical protein